MERGSKNGVDHVYALVGGRKLAVEIPMTETTYNALAQGQKGVPAEMTGQMQWAVEPASRPKN